MITKLEIKGFKSLVDVSIELGAVNVFIGANGSGKSNLLEAVGMLSAIASGNLEDEPLRYRGVRRGIPYTFCTSLKDISYSPVSLSASDQDTAYRTMVMPNPVISSRWNLIKEEIDFEGRRLIERESDGIKVYNLSEGYHAKLPYNQAAKSDIRTSVSLSPLGMMTTPDGRFQSNQVKDKDTAERNAKLVVSFLDDLSSFAIFTPSTPQLRGSDDIPRDPLGLGGSGLGNAIEEMLRADPEKLGPFELDDVYELIDWADSLHADPEFESGTNLGVTKGPIRLRIGDRFMGEMNKSVSLLEASEGALYVLFMLALVGHERAPKIFAVDNFDQALHPRLACALTRLVSDQILEDGSRQMLATTHNPLVLDGLDLLDDRVRLFTVDRDSNGATQINRVMVSEELMAQAEKGLSLSRLWVMGRLGGVPKYL